MRERTYADADGAMEALERLRETDATILPVILLGGKKFNMHQGQYMQVPFNTDIANFYYTMLKAMQVPGTDFNGSSTSLPGLFG